MWSHEFVSMATSLMCSRLKGGVLRQGCPLAPYLFLIVGEVLNILISQVAIRGELQGINCQGV